MFTNMLMYVCGEGDHDDPQKDPESQIGLENKPVLLSFVCLSFERCGWNTSCG